MTVLATPTPSGAAGGGRDEDPALLAASLSARRPRPSPDHPRVLVVDADISSLSILTSELPREGFEVVAASDGRTGLRRLVEDQPDLVLLDVQLPDQAGLAVFRLALRLTPVSLIVVTERNEEIDVVLSLESGAADHVTKPIRLRELVARMRAVLRRDELTREHVPAAAGEPAGATEATSAQLAVADVPDDEVLRVGNLTLDAARHEVLLDGRVVTLSRKEFDLLALLLSNAGSVVTRDQCMDLLWWNRELADTRTLDTHIRRLRQKIEVDPASPRRIVTVRGIGYRFDA